MHHTSTHPRVLRLVGVVATLFELSFLMTFGLQAQTATAVVIGTVTDASGATVAGASVNVKNVETGINHQVTTDAQGQFGFLLEKGYRVRVLVRNLKRLQEHAWASMVEIVQGDLQDQRAVTNALSGVNTAYYLVHNMLSGRNYEQRELAAAQRFSANAGSLGVQHIIYLGGLAAPDEKIGAHLRSRLQTGAMLRSLPAEMQSRIKADVTRRAAKRRVGRKVQVV